VTKHYSISLSISNRFTRLLNL